MKIIWKLFSYLRIRIIQPTVEDYLKLYNNTDVVLFLEALQKQCEPWTRIIFRIYEKTRLHTRR